MPSAPEPGAVARAISRMIPSRILRAASYTSRPDGEFWWSDPASATGVSRVTPQTAMALSSVQSCVHLIAGVIAALPLPVYRNLGDAGRERDRSSPVWDLLNFRADPRTSSFEFRRAMTADAMLHGNALATPGPDGLRFSMIRRGPGTWRLKTWDGDRILYEVTTGAGAVKTYAPEEVFHLRDLLAPDGLLGMSRIEQAAVSLGIPLAAQGHAATSLRNGTRLRGYISTDKNIPPKTRKENLAAWHEQYGGPGNSGKDALLTDGAKYYTVGTTNEQAQLLEIMGFGVDDVARLYLVPAHMIGRSEKQTSWGTGVEQAAIQFVQFCLMTWFEMWESTLQTQALDEPPDVAYAEHLVDGLLRGDHKTRMESLRIAIESGQLTPDEARKIENRMTREDGQGGRFWMPMNYRYADEPAAVADRRRPAAALSGGNGKTVDAASAAAGGVA